MNIAEYQEKTHKISKEDIVCVSGKIRIKRESEATSRVVGLILIESILQFDPKSRPILKIREVLVPIQGCPF